jgi:hypothetical protein
MEQTDLRELVARAEAHARAIYRTRPEVQPLLHIVVAHAPPVIVEFGWASDAERAAKLELTRHLLATLGADAYLILHETWALIGPSDAPEPGEDGWVPPRLHPDRVECIYIGAVARSGAKQGVLFELKRGGEGLVADLVRIHGDGVLSGPIAELFEPGDVAGRA